MEYDRVRYQNKNYAVIKVRYKNIDLPVVIDWDDFNTIKNLDKSWKSNMYGFISCSHKCNDDIKEVYMHEIIMAVKMKDLKKKRKMKPIIHINRIGLDNRRDNLIYDDNEKTYHKNIKKKSRTTTLPANSGINIDEIPTYVWYMKPNGSHGDRFMVDIGDINWKTTSSKGLSLRYKLEEAKTFLRDLKKENPTLFKEYSMNGDYTKEGERLIDSYYTIVQKAGYEHIDRFIPEYNTDKLLKPGKISRKEKQILTGQKKSLHSTGKKRRVVNSLPKDGGVSANDIPKYSYFRPPYNGRGSYFTVIGHPQQTKKVWQSSSSVKKSVKEKFNELLTYLDTLEESDSDSDSESEESSSYDST